MTEAELPEGTVTVLFTDLVESTRLNQSRGDDVARDVGRRVDELARRVIADHRGVLIKEMGDGLMAAFASARRAVAASREIQVEMDRLRRDHAIRDATADLAMRIGLHTGEVLTEAGDIHGETVIIAKRIEGLAPPGGILASETVYGVLGTVRDELIDQGPTQLKGITSEWRTFLVPVPTEDRVAGLADSEPTPYIGRVAERATLNEMVEAASAGRGGMVLIGGPAGLGKSRLTREATALGVRLGMNVLTGHCLDMESPPPYQPSIDHLEQAARQASTEGFRAALGENAPEVAKLLPSLRQRYDDIPPSPELAPEQERRYMLSGVGEFIERAAAVQPLLLVFEDLHWADESSLLLLRHLGGRIAEVPVMVIGTYRDDELEPDRPLTAAIGPLVRDLGALDLRPKLLTPEEVEAVLAARAGSAPPQELIDLMMVETQGNPFFVEELFRHLRDEGRLLDAEGAWLDGFAIGDTEVPQGIRLVIQRRLDRLTPDHRAVLATAAVIGRAFDFRLLAAASSAEEDALFDAVEAAERTHVIEEVEGDRDARYAFIHEQVRQTLLGELSRARRQRVHLRIAEELESKGGKPVEVAHHFHHAGPTAPAERTVAALIDAAASSIDTLAFEDALRHLARAEPLVEDANRLVFGLMKVRALRGAGRIDDALETLDAELRAADHLRDQLDLRLRRVRLLNDQYRAAEGIEDIEVLTAAAHDDPELEIEVQLARGRAHYILSLDDPEHANESRSAYEAAYTAAEAAGDRGSMARALLPTTWFTDYWPSYRPIAQANVAQAVALAEADGDEDLILDARSASMHQGGTGFDPKDAEELLERLEARRDPVKLNAHCFWMMWQYHAVGRFSDAVDMCDRGMALAELTGTKPVQYGSIKAIALASAGRFDEVEAAIAQEVTDNDHPFGQAMASLARSVFLHRLAAWAPAAASITDTLKRSVELDRAWIQAWAAALLIEAAAHLGTTAPDDVIEMSEMSTMVGRSPRDLARAEEALLAGRPDAALEHLAAHPTSGSALIRQHVLVADATARAQLAAGVYDEAVRVAAEGLAMAEKVGYDSEIWRLRTLVARGLEAVGDTDSARGNLRTAHHEFDVLARRIADPDLRAWFTRQPLAPREGDDD